jgi:hypothetical protein
LFHLVFESHDGRALVPIPKRSTSLRATSTLEWWIGLKALDPDRPIREAMIDREHDLPLTRQAEVLRISRGSVYYLPRPVPDADLAIMRRLDRLHLEFPFAGSRMLRGLLAAVGRSAIAIGQQNPGSHPAPPALKRASPRPLTCIRRQRVSNRS